METESYNPIIKSILSASVSYFAVTHKDTSLCELFITCTYNKSAWCASNFECEMTTELSVHSNSLLLCAAECARQGISPIFSAFTIRWSYGSFIVFLLTQANKGQRTHVTAFTKNKGESISDHCAANMLMQGCPGLILAQWRMTYELMLGCPELICSSMKTWHTSWCWAV